MLAMHCITYKKSPSASYLKRFLFLVSLLFSLSFSSVAFAKTKNTYGPTKPGESLWVIAKQLNKNRSNSIQQLSLAIYELNPKAFKSGNMNRLQAGALLNIPDNEAILSTSSKDAKKKLSKHQYELKLLSASDSQLKIAKTNVKKKRASIKRLQKKLGKYKHKSKRWNSTYQKLVASKRQYSKAKTKVVGLHKLLKKKAQLKVAKKTEAKALKTAQQATKKDITEKLAELSNAALKNRSNQDQSPKTQTETLKISSTKTSIAKVDQRLGTIQKSIKTIGMSNTRLMVKIQELSSLNKRVEVLEKELGKNDKLVLELKESLETAQQMMQQQSQSSAQLLKNFNQFEVNLKKSEAQAIAQKQASEEAQKVAAELEKNNKIADEADVKEEPTAASTPEENIALNENQSAETQTELEATENIVETKSVDVSNQNTSNTEEESVISEAVQLDSNVKELTNVTQEIATTIQADEDSGTINEELANSSKSDADTVALKNHDTKDEENNSAEEIVATTKENKSDFIKTSLFNNTNTNKASVSSHQRWLKGSSLSYTSDNYWVNLLKDKLILIVSVLNGLILIFVLFKLFRKNKRKNTLQNTRLNQAHNENYISWQDRHNPKQV